MVTESYGSPTGRQAKMKLQVLPAKMSVRSPLNLVIYEICFTILFFDKVLY